MKIELGPPVLPLVRPSDSFLPPPPPPDAAVDSAVAASVLSGATYFNEELSVPHNFTMPQGRGDDTPRPLAAPRSRQQLASAVVKRKPFRFSSAQPQAPRGAAASVEPATEPPPPTTTSSEAPTPTPTPTPTPAPTAAPRRPAVRTRGGRRRGSGRTSSASSSPSPPRPTARRVPPPPRTRPATPAAARPVPSPSHPVPSPARRSHSRARQRPSHETEPLMTFDYDLEEDIDLSDFMFPEFGRRLRRSAVADDDVFDAAAVRRLEAEWSARRRRRSLLPGDENRVHGHHHHEHAAEHAKSCSIMGVQYELGEVIGVASDNCLECRCAAQAMFCSPKCCFFSLEERVLREGRQRRPDEDTPRPHPLQAFIRQ